MSMWLRSVSRPLVSMRSMTVLRSQSPAMAVRMFSTTEEAGQSTSFVSRLKKKMEKSFEDTKKTLTQQASEENERRMMQLLLNTPKGEFNMKTLKGFYTQLKVEAEAKADNIIASRDEQFQQGLDQIKRFLRILDGFNEYEQQYPILIRAPALHRVALTTMSDFKEVEIVVNGCRSTQDMHSWIQKRKEKGLLVPESPQQIQTLMTQEQPKRQRLQGGYLTRLYIEQDAPRKKRLGK